MVSKETFIIYMTTTTFCIISLCIYIIRLIRMNNNILDLIYMVDAKHDLIEKELSNIINEK